MAKTSIRQQTIDMQMLITNKSMKQHAAHIRTSHFVQYKRAQKKTINCRHLNIKFFFDITKVLNVNVMSIQDPRAYSKRIEAEQNYWVPRLWRTASLRSSSNLLSKSSPGQTAVGVIAPFSTRLRGDFHMSSKNK
jgi:hypothetical protein